MPIPVLIPAYKNPEALYRCRGSVIKQGHEREGVVKRVLSLIVVHNNSVENIGYTAACNRLLTFIGEGEPYALLINQDVQLLHNCIAAAVAFMDAHPKCAIGGFQQRSSADPDLITHGGTGDVFKGEHVTGRVSRGDCAKSRPFLWLNGAALILRMDAVRRIGLMDERFFLCCSDSEYCIRAWRNGWQCWYIAEAACLHDPGGVSSCPNPEQLEIIRADQAKFAELMTAQVDDLMLLTTGE